MKKYFFASFLMFMAFVLLSQNKAAFHDSGEDLPQWLSEGGYIGISDPHNDTDFAYNQAVQRALALYVFATKVELKAVIGSSSTIDETETYEQSRMLYRLYKKSEGNISYNVDRIYRTKYNETIVIINVSDYGIYSTSLDVVVDSFSEDNIHYNKDDVKDYSYVRKIMFAIDSNDLASLWSSAIDNEDLTINNKCDNGIEYSIERNNNFIYKDYGGISFCVNSAENEYGLWNSFIDVFIQSLYNFVGSVAYQGNGVQCSNSSEYDISRNTINTEITCSLSKLFINNNRLYADWEMKVIKE